MMQKAAPGPTRRVSRERRRALPPGASRSLTFNSRPPPTSRPGGAARRRRAWNSELLATALSSPRIFQDQPCPQPATRP
jgi:hypothetical protein